MMDTNIVIRTKTKDIEKTPAIEDYVTKKLRMLEKFFGHYARESGELYFDIEIGKTTEHHRHGDVFRAEINFTAGSVSMRAEHTTDDLYAAIDGAKDEMEKELRRRKGKDITLFRKGAARIKELFRSRAQG